MNRRGFIFLILVGTMIFVLGSQPREGLAQKGGKGRLLYLTLSAGFKHSSAAPSRDIVKEIGEQSGAFEVTFAEDVSPFTAQDLAHYDAVMFYTTGELPMTEDQEKAFIDFIRSGHGFVGVHSATDTFYKWPDYGKMIGGYFDGHPWHQEVTIDVVDPKSKLVSFLGKSFKINDEIYQIKEFEANTSHVLLKLDPSSVDLTKSSVHRRDYGWPIAWTRREGKGRVFYTGLGHEEAVWKDQRFQTLLVNGIKWAMGTTK